MTSVTIHGASGLITSNVIHSSSGGTPFETACLHGKMIYDNANLLQSCPFEKTRERCMDDLRSRLMFQNIPANTTDMARLANAMNICTPGMKSLIDQINLDSSSTTNDKIRANELTQICNF
jgi:hypothetical protein